MVQEALLAVLREPLYFSRFVPVPTGASTGWRWGVRDDDLLGPTFKQALAFSVVGETPVDSVTFSAVASPHPMFVGSRP